MKLNVKNPAASALADVDKSLNRLWVDLVGFDKELTSHFAQILTPSQQIRSKTVLSSWVRIKQSAEHFAESLEKMKQNAAPVDPVDINYPWDNDEFKQQWQYWRDYLAEQHGIKLYSHAENKQLELLSQYANNEQAKAKAIIDYAMAGLYKMFFPLDSKIKAGKGRTITSNPDDEY